MSTKETTEEIAKIAAKLMTHEDSDVRRVAASALSQFEEPAVPVETVKVALEDIVQVQNKRMVSQVRTIRSIAEGVLLTKREEAYEDGLKRIIQVVNDALNRE